MKGKRWPDVSLVVEYILVGWLLYMVIMLVLTLMAQPVAGAEGGPGGGLLYLVDSNGWTARAAACITARIWRPYEHYKYGDSGPAP